MNCLNRHGYISAELHIKGADGRTTVVELEDIIMLALHKITGLQFGIRNGEKRYYVYPDEQIMQNIKKLDQG